MSLTVNLTVRWGKAGRYALAGAVVVLLGGCSTAQEHGTVTIASPRADTLKAADLERSGIAFVTPSTVTGQEQDRSTLCLIFSQLMQELRARVRVIPLAETLSSVNRTGSAEDYKRLLNSDRNAELLDPALLSLVSRATGARYIAQLKMARFQQESQDRFGVVGLHVIETKKANIRLSLQIWNSTDGSIAWEGTYELELAREAIMDRPISFHAVVEAAARKLIAQIP